MRCRISRARFNDSFGRLAISVMKRAAATNWRTSRRSSSVFLRRRKATIAIVCRRHRFLISQMRTLLAMLGASSLYSLPVSSSRKASLPARKKT